MITKIFDCHEKKSPKTLTGPTRNLSVNFSSIGSIAANQNHANIISYFGTERASLTLSRYDIKEYEIKTKI